MSVGVEARKFWPEMVRGKGTISDKYCLSEIGLMKCVGAPMPVIGCQVPGQHWPLSVDIYVLLVIVVPG